MIRWTYAFVDRPMPRFAESSAFWTAVTETELSARQGADGEFATLLPAEGDAYVKLQGVGDAGGAHLDLAVEDVPAEVHRTHDLGAAAVVRHGERAVPRSPGGQLFCVVPWHGEAVRAGRRYPPRRHAQPAGPGVPRHRP
jgi:hypothetical protein